MSGEGQQVSPAADQQAPPAVDQPGPPPFVQIATIKAQRAEILKGTILEEYKLENFNPDFWGTPFPKESPSLPAREIYAAFALIILSAAKAANRELLRQFQDAFAEWPEA
jgi:hypothetical protein